MKDDVKLTPYLHSVPWIRAFRNIRLYVITCKSCGIDFERPWWRLFQRHVVHCKLDTFVFIHWPCYCAVHVYVVIHICDSMRSLWVKVNLLRFFIIVDFISVLPLEIHLLRENGCGAIFRLNPATFLWLSYVRTRISNPIYLGYLCVQWFDVRCGCPYFIIFCCVLL
jgi:hypothetical protein